MGEITIEVGDTYEDLHEQLLDVVGDQYEQNTRKQLEDHIHSMNQQFERQHEELPQDGHD